MHRRRENIPVDGRRHGEPIGSSYREGHPKEQFAEFSWLLTGSGYIVSASSPVTRAPKPDHVTHTRGGVSPMTPKQILDSFSETLVRDDRILSAAERALVA